MRKHLKRIDLKKVRAKLKIFFYSKNTFMLIPHSEKRIFSIHFSNLTVFALGIVVFFILFLGFFLSFKSSERMADYDYYFNENIYFQRQIGNIHQILPNITRSQNTLFGKLDKLFTILSVETKNEPFYSELFETIDPISRYDSINNKIENISSYIKSTRVLFTQIPSIFPLNTKSFWYSSPFGWRAHPITGIRVLHTGLDIATLPGTPIVAPADAVVKTSGWAGPYGNMVYLIHERGYSTRFGHMMKTAVYSGETVKKGQVIGFVGTTGMSTGYHLHYEVMLNQDLLDPMTYLFLDRFGH